MKNIILKPSKLHGTYPQKQKGLFMQRIPVFAGRLTGEQLRKLSMMAIEFTGDTPLHLTTRQDIEFHNVNETDTQKLLDSINETGFSTFGAGGDSVRNITVCPCCKFDEEAYDVEPLAEKVKQEVFKCGLLESLGRKFKITFAGCDNPQTKPFINDLSFIATSESTVCVIGAGSLGAGPEPGIVMYDELNISEVIPLTIAAIEMFAEHGERNNRRKARFRHIRQCMGDKNFLSLLNNYFEKHKDKYQSKQNILGKGLAGWEKAVTIQTIGGDIKSKDAIRLAKLTEQSGARIRINNYHGIDIYSKDEFSVPDEFSVYTGLPRLVACPGSRSCPNGIVDCTEALELIAEQLKDNKSFHGKTIALSGCPNNCSCSAVADIGLVGRLKEKKPAFKVTINSGNGNTNSVGKDQGIVFTDNAGNLIKENYFKSFKEFEQKRSK